MKVKGYMYPQMKKPVGMLTVPTKITLKSPPLPNPCETSERINFNGIDKKQLI